MEYHDTTFFCEPGHENAPIFKIPTMYGRYYPITIKIGKVTIHCDEQQLIAFKNSVISEYERIRRE